MSFGRCPKCRLPLDAARRSETCPRCGLVFAKYLAAQRGERVPRPSPSIQDSYHVSFCSSLLEVPERVSRTQWIGRCFLFALIAIWGWRIWATDITELPTLVHLTLIPFHEAGHVVFWPFGEFMCVAGGTLGQWIIPIICAVVLHRQNGDNFGAAMAAWWLATSVMDASVYAYDALDPVLPLIGGGTGADNFHDFVYLFEAMGQLDRARGWGRLLHFLGTLLMLGSLTWAGLILLRQRRKIGEGDSALPGNEP